MERLALRYRGTVPCGSTPCSSQAPESRSPVSIGWRMQGCIDGAIRSGEQAAQDVIAAGA
jgi:hypothetical protein